VPIGVGTPVPINSKVLLASDLRFEGRLASPRAAPITSIALPIIPERDIT
jgi:hypothetical protein